MKKPKYNTAKAFRSAIRDRLRALSRETGEPSEDIYRRVAADRFLARLDWSKWTAKGGYALQRRFSKARRTKDIDLATFHKQFSATKASVQSERIVNALQETARVDIGDFFEFQVEETGSLDGHGKGGVRCMVRCFIAGSLWSTFPLDAVIQDETAFPPEDINGDDFLSFSGIEPAILKVPAKEEVFAEKIHAYTLPRDRENTRVKDLLDLAILVDSGLDAVKAKQAIDAVFSIRKRHSPPSFLSPPPESWQHIFIELVSQTELSFTLEKSYESVSDFYSKLNL